MSLQLLQKHVFHTNLISIAANRPVDRNVKGEDNDEQGVARSKLWLAEIAGQCVCGEVVAHPTLQAKLELFEALRHYPRTSGMRSIRTAMETLRDS